MSASTNTYNAVYAPPRNQTIIGGTSPPWPSRRLPSGPSFPEARPTAAAPSDTISGTADAVPGAHSLYARGPQRPAPAYLNEAGLGVTPELRITADHDVHPYLIQLHRGGQLLAYAVRDGYGWAICARTLLPQRRRATARSGIATIGRTGHDRYAVETALLLVAARGGTR